MKVCISQIHESTSPLHFDYHPLLPIPKRIVCVKVTKLKSETHSYNICLDCMKKAVEHRRILPVGSLGVSLPFRQAFWTIPQLIYCDHDAFTTLTC
jgi:hypothetical protein